MGGAAVERSDIVMRRRHPAVRRLISSVRIEF